MKCSDKEKQSYSSAEEGVPNDVHGAIGSSGALVRLDTTTKSQALTSITSDPGVAVHTEVQVCADMHERQPCQPTSGEDGRVTSTHMATRITDISLAVRARRAMAGFSFTA